MVTLSPHVTALVPQAALFFLLAPSSPLPFCPDCASHPSGAGAPGSAWSGCLIEIAPATAADAGLPPSDSGLPCAVCVGACSLSPAGNQRRLVQMCPHRARPASAASHHHHIQPLGEVPSAHPMPCQVPQPSALVSNNMTEAVVALGRGRGVGEEKKHGLGGMGR